MTTPTLGEMPVPEGALLVSKTDAKGHITYANEDFALISGYPARHLVGQPHSIVRHPRMPRGLFRLLWSRLEQKEEVFAFILNRARAGHGYWVFSHLTPTLDAQGRLRGFHAARRAPNPAAVPRVRALYDELLGLEATCANPVEAATRSAEQLQQRLAERGQEYHQLVFGLESGEAQS